MAKTTQDDAKRYGSRYVTELMLTKDNVPVIIEKKIDEKVSLFQVFINGSIYVSNPEGSVAYTDLFNILRQDKENLIVIYINSPGGSVNLATHLVSEIAASKSTVVTVAEGLVASAATLIWGAGRERRILPQSIFMYHFSSHGDSSNSISVQEGSAAIVDYMTKTIIDPCLSEGLITDEEYDRIINKRKNVYISGLEMIKREKQNKVKDR